MLKATRVVFVSEDLSACRICLATNIKLYSIPDGLEDNFTELMGVEFSDDDGLPQHLCPHCRLLLLRAAALRARCRRSEWLLRQAKRTQPFLSTDDILQIDRKFHRLALNLTQLSVYNFDSHKKKETIDIKDTENEEDSFDDIEDLPDINGEVIDPLIEDIASEVIIEPKVEKVEKDNRKALVDNIEPDKLDGKPNLLFEIDGLNMGRIKVKPVDAKEENLPQLSVYNFDSHKKKETIDIKDTENEEDSFDDVEDLPDINGEVIDPLTEDIASEVIIKPKAAEVKKKNRKALVDNLELDKLDGKPNLLFEIDGLNMGRIKVKSVDAKEKKIKKMRMEFKKQKAEKEAKKVEAKAKRISNLLRFVTGKKRNAEPLTKWQLQLRRAENNFLPNFDHAEFEKEHDCKLKILTMEEQLEEIAERKQSSNYLNLDFKCEFCGRGFEFERSFKNHMAKHDPAIGKFECEVCHIRFRTQYLRHRHLDYHKMKFVCNICSFVTRAKHLARNHYLMHTGKVFKCKQCDATFTKSTSYFGHVRLNHPSRDAVCELCGDSFIGALGLRHHKAKAHKDLSKAKYECGSCGVRFASSDAMKKHANGRRKCDNSMKACAECGEVFSSGERLKQHTDERHLLVQYWCEECSQSFVSQASLETHHQRVHLHIKWPAYGRTREMNREYYKKIKERTRLKALVVCEICGAKLMSNAALERHQQSQCRRERSAKAYECPHCVKSCATRQGLQLHITLHTGEKPYKCSQCPLEFRQSGALKRHHNKVHLGIDTRVQCEYCGKYFSTPSTRKLHINTVHLKMPQPPRTRRGKGDD